MGGYVARRDEGWSAFNILTVHMKERDLLGWPRRRWKNNITMDLKEIDINTRNWVNVAQDREYRRALGNAALNLRVP